ncbi:hypothetical protein MHLP_04405 [Candidatus Mycoplasma haematolamae str. Purdue]|uniref:Uncharacterized protein n=1 Tax=Mycoplasma haematolamae (strain Purdue) TaxID=1212765 RepID=I7CH24_MYCHA|nr:hypothetical protein MHLP_04405 [Candidatus Mycoplasma haematolamae str. Purdue]
MGAISFLDAGAVHQNFAPEIQKLIWAEKVVDSFEFSDDNYIRIAETHRLRDDEVKQKPRELYLMWGSAATWYMKDCLFGKNSDPNTEALCEKHRNFYKGVPEVISKKFTPQQIRDSLRVLEGKVGSQHRQDLLQKWQSAVTWYLAYCTDENNILSENLKYCEDHKLNYLFSLEVKN